MKKIDFIVYSILVFALGIGIYTIYNLVGSPPKTNFQTLTSDENDVEFQITPLAPNEFQIAMNTHSVDLDFDLTQISTLHDNFGKDYYPFKWDGSEPGGHHREGILKFLPINNNAKSIKLVIIDSTKREFMWDLK